MWELRKSQEAGDDDKYLGLFHVKMNAGKLQSPRGYRLEFCEDAIKVERQDLGEIEELRSHMGTQAQILSLLKRGAMTKEAVAEELDITEAAAKQALWRLSQKGKVLQMEDEYGLSA